MNTRTVSALCTVFLLAACGGPSRDAGWELEPGSEDVGWLLGVWSPGGGTRYMVGGVMGEGRVVTDSSGTLARVEGLPDVPLLTDVYGFSASDIFAVGDAGTVLHFDGDMWTEQSTPTTETLWGVWGAAGDDVWAVGGRGTFSSEPTLLHYDGEVWESVSLPDVESTAFTALYGVWGTSANNVYAVGRGGIVLHREGDVWVQETSGTSDDLYSVHGTGADDVLAVGGRPNGRVVIWNGTLWRAESLAPLPGLNGVFMASRGVAHLVGVEGTIARLDIAAGTFREEVPATALDLQAVFGDASGTLTAVGGNFTAQPGNEEGVAFVRTLGEGE